MTSAANSNVSMVYRESNGRCVLICFDSTASCAEQRCMLARLVSDRPPFQPSVSSQFAPQRSSTTSTASTTSTTSTASTATATAVGVATPVVTATAVMMARRVVTATPVVTATAVMKTRRIAISTPVATSTPVVTSTPATPLTNQSTPRAGTNTQAGSHRSTVT